MDRLILGAVAVRLVAALVLIVGPWTDEAGELDGWDVARFQEIAEAEGRPWVDYPVEYPPGSVVLIDAVSQPGLVQTHRWLVALSFAVDVAIAAGLAGLAGTPAAARYLVLGLPLVPMGLLRFDLWAAALAVLAVAALLQRRPGTFGLVVAAGAMIKIWPGLLVGAALAARRYRAAGAALAVSALAVGGWVAATGWSIEGIEQVVSLRGATGWHVESLPGTIVALTSDAEPSRALDAYRIGRLSDAVVMAGRVAAVAVIAVAVALGWRRSAGNETGGDELQTVGAVMLASTAALIVSAPLLSPQFLLWLVPWAALLAWPGGRPPAPTLLTAAAVTLTGATLAWYGPPRLAEATPATLLLVRNLVVLGVVAATIRDLARRPVPPATGQAERNDR